MAEVETEEEVVPELRSRPTSWYNFGADLGRLVPSTPRRPTGGRAFLEMEGLAPREPGV